MEYDPKKHDALIWNDWSERMMQRFTEYNWTTVTGPNASWKTTCAANWALKFWMSSPFNTAIVLTSTSLSGLRKRIWKEIVRFYRPYANEIGNLVASDMCIRFAKGSDEAGIFCVATGQDNDVQKAVEKIIGFHATNVMAVVDEMQATNDAIVKSAISLQAGADNFRFIGLGNADSELDPHGLMSEPLNGWDSVSVEDEEWETRRGVCVHLDGFESPRVKEGDEFYPGLLRKVDNDTAIRDEGEDSPFMWQYRRGFWAPQGVTKTVLSTVDGRKFRTEENRRLDWEIHSRRDARSGLRGIRSLCVAPTFLRFG